MTGPARTPPGASAPGDDAQSSAASSEPLEWQNELDVAIADIDSRLRRTRCRAANVQSAAQAGLRQPAQLTPPPRESTRGADDIVLAVRIPKPLFEMPWPFRRRKRQWMIQFSDYRIS